MNRHCAMSASRLLHPDEQTLIVSFCTSASGQTATYALQQTMASFDHFVGAQEQHRRHGEAERLLSSVARSLLPQLPSATFGAAGSGVAASCSVVCSSVALATGLIIAMGIATCTLRLAARNTPSGSPRFLALPVLTLSL